MGNPRGQRAQPISALDYLATGKTASIETALHLAWVDVAQAGSLGQVRSQEVLAQFQEYYEGPLEDSYTEEVFGEIDRRLDAVRHKQLDRNLSYDMGQRILSDAHKTAIRKYVRRWMGTFTDISVHPDFLHQFHEIDLSIKGRDKYVLPIRMLSNRPHVRRIREFEYWADHFRIVDTTQKLIRETDSPAWWCHRWTNIVQAFTTYDWQVRS